MKKIIRLAVLLLTASFLSGMPLIGSAAHVVTLGTFKISLGSYADWNNRAAESGNCDLYQLDCSLDEDEHRVVGDSTTTANSAAELQSLVWQFGFSCLDQAAVFADIGQHVYPDVGEFGGPLHRHFEKEANRCWDHYDNIYQSNKDKF